MVAVWQVASLNSVVGKTKELPFGLSKSLEGE